MAKFNGTVDPTKLLNYGLDYKECNSNTNADHSRLVGPTNQTKIERGYTFPCFNAQDHYGVIKRHMNTNYTAPTKHMGL